MEIGYLFRLRMEDDIISKDEMTRALAWLRCHSSPMFKPKIRMGLSCCRIGWYIYADRNLNLTICLMFLSWDLYFLCHTAWNVYPSCNWSNFSAGLSSGFYFIHVYLRLASNPTTEIAQFEPSLVDCPAFRNFSWSMITYQSRQTVYLTTPGKCGNYLIPQLMKSLMYFWRCAIHYQQLSPGLWHLQ